MNLTQYALMTFHTTGAGVSVADYFERTARSDEGDALWVEADALAGAMRGFIEAREHERGSVEGEPFRADLAQDLPA